jgi:hypothetical protein
LFHLSRPVIREFLDRPPLLFDSAGVGTVVTQQTARCTAAATSNSIISIANIADAFTRATAMQSICNWELTKNIKASAAKRPGFLLDIDQMLLIISTKKKRNYQRPPANLAGNAISPAARLRQIQSFILPDREAFNVSKLTLENHFFVR